MSVKPIPTPEETPLQTPMVSPVRDVRRVARNTTAVAGELKEFLAKMHGRSAKERLGIVATSGLVKSFISATFIFAILIAAFTVAPFFWGKLMAGGAATPETAEAEQGEQPAAAGEPAAPTADPDVIVGQPGEVDLSDPKAITDKLGIGEAKDAPTNVNPLDGKEDDLLDGLK